MEDMDRTSLLKQLIRMEQDLGKIQENLSRFPWDSEAELCTLEASHLQKVLTDFIDGKIGADRVEEWANMIEGRDDIEIADHGNTSLSEIIYKLANPVLEGDIDPNYAKILRDLLQ